MIRTLLSTALVSLVFAMLGCAPRVKELNVAYSPIEALTKVDVKSPKGIKVEPFTDRRASDALGEISGGGGPYGQYGSIGKYVAKADVAKIVTDAVKMELANQGYQIIQQNEDFILSGTVLALNGIQRHGFFGGAVEGGAQVSFALKDRREGRVVWSDILNGKSKAEYGVFPDIGARFEEAVNLAIKDVIDKLVKSDSLRAALR